MADESATETSSTKPKAKAKAKAKAKKQKASEREQSTIAFPYFDMETAIGVARVILNAGALSVTREQLAGLLDSSTNSGTFLTKMSATRMFGLITTGSGMVELTELGSYILDSDEKRSRKARADAFLAVPLFRKVYDEFRGRQLPPRPLPLEHAFVKLGVSNSQKGTARLAFDRSAQQAGYFSAGTDRLIEPIIGGAGAAPRAPAPPKSQEGDVIEPSAKSRASGRAELPHFMHMLIEALPAVGTTWTVDGRAKWLQGAAAAFDLSYKGDGAITIQAKAAPNADKKED